MITEFYCKQCDTTMAIDVLYCMQCREKVEVREKVKKPTEKQKWFALELAENLIFLAEQELERVNIKISFTSIWDEISDIKCTDFPFWVCETDECIAENVDLLTPFCPYCGTKAPGDK